MLGTSLLNNVTLPESFEYRVEGRIETPLAIVELHQYHFRQPQQALFDSPRGFLDLALTHRPGEARGSYVSAPGFSACPLGDIIFIPAYQGLRSQWGAGVQSSVCCQFNEPRADGRDDEDWALDELKASLNVRSPFVRDALVRLAREIESPGFWGEALAEAICTQLAIELGRYFRATRSIADSAAGRLSPAQLRHIEERVEAPGKLPTVASLARECGLSTRHFFRMFRATTGNTLSEFAAERRIARAKALLAERSSSERGPAIKEIAYRCGFETAAAFSVAFRRATGVTPRQYRLNVRS